MTEKDSNIWLPYVQLYGHRDREEGERERKNEILTILGQKEVNINVLTTNNTQDLSVMPTG